MTHINDFFISSNSINDITEADYQKIDYITSIFDAIARTTYQSLYIIDYYKKIFLYVSDNQLFLCGNTPKEVKEMGYMFYMNNVPEKEQSMLAEINKSGFNFYETLPIKERTSYTISYNFHIGSGKKLMLINHKLTPVLLTKSGKIWLAVCMVSLSSHNTSGHIKIYQDGQTNFWNYSLESHRWIQNSGILLSDKEKDILLLSAQGYTMNEIADKLYLAVDTIKFHKRKLFEKLEVKNITEALSFAINRKLI